MATKSEPSQSRLTLPYDVSVEQLRLLDGALDILLAQQTGMLWVRGRELRHLLATVPKAERDELIQSCVPRLLQRQSPEAENYLLTLDGLIACSDQRPRDILDAILGLIAERYARDAEGRRQRGFTWGDLRRAAGFSNDDYRIAWYTFWISRIGDSGRTPPKASNDENHPSFDYEFWIKEVDVELMSEHADAEAWASLQRKLRLGALLDPPLNQGASVSVFHVSVEVLGAVSIMNDLSEDRLRREIVDPFRSGKRFLVDGKFVDKDTIGGIKIVRTAKTLAEYSREHDEAMLRRGVNDLRPFDRRQLPLRGGEDISFELLGEALAAEAVTTDLGEDRILVLLHAFHETTKPFRTRRKGKSPIGFDDEYDVQDLLHAHLLALTARVDPEEWSPSYAGQHMRMDFLLREFEAAVEAKRVRDRTHAAKIAQELIVDFDHYVTHPDVVTLYCLVYDPELLIENPEAIRADLSRRRSVGDLDLEVHVVITPPHRGEP